MNTGFMICLGSPPGVFLPVPVPVQVPVGVDYVDVSITLPSTRVWSTRGASIITLPSTMMSSAMVSSLMVSSAMVPSTMVSSTIVSSTMVSSTIVLSTMVSSAMVLRRSASSLLRLVRRRQPSVSGARLVPAPCSTRGPS